MELLFLIIIIIMLGLAIFDLVVGVSNDASNFLTSAVGSQASKLKIIMILASAGVLVGALSSGGMMEIARKGIFNPSLFSFQNIIFIYLVVMLTDILLLDFFNSMKLPTSTTISIVFELLGASMAISFLIVYDSNQSVSEWLGYINTKKAMEMIVAIFVSVAVAFIIGWLIQYVLRAIMTFDYKKYLRLGGSVFGGISIFVVVWFIINVAFKHSPLKDHQIVLFLSNNIGSLFLISFVLSTTLFYLLSANKKFDTFRIITLIGTFALAMAFASNDLVNFIGVPVAGLEGYTYWINSGIPAPEFTMEVFNEPGSRTSLTPIFLIIAGIIMMITLVKSKKARNVIQTAVNLSRQSDGVERFSGNALSQNFVRFVSFIANRIIRMVPDFITQTIRRRYARKAPVDPNAKELPAAFDFIRASVNLIVAASLISLGTSLKLPLSTTYVTFMVVMGTSLADRAWNRDSAVYRVSGVFAVVGGWFLTAASAFAISAIFAVIVHSYLFSGIVIVMALVGFGIFLTNRYTDNQLQPEITVALPEDWFLLSSSEVRPKLRNKLKEISASLYKSSDNLIQAIINSDRKIIQKLDKQLSEQNDINLYYQATLIQLLRTVDARDRETGRVLLEFYVQENEILKEISQVVNLSKLHILNLHTPLDEVQKNFLQNYIQLLHMYDQAIQSTNGKPSNELEYRLQSINDQVEIAVNEQIKGLTEQKYSYKNSRLYFSTIIRHLQVSNFLHRMHLIISEE